MSTQLRTKFGKSPVIASSKSTSKYAKKKIIMRGSRIKDHYPLKTGHRTRYWCCQDKNRKQKARPSQREGAKPRDTLGMLRYDCKSKLHISYRTNPGRERCEEKAFRITIWLEHHMKHTPYYDVSLPPEAAALIRENIEWFSPHEVAKRVLPTYPAITANQVHAAWTTMSETLWKRDREQLPSVKILLGELGDDVTVLDVPKMEGVEQIAWVMKNILMPLSGKIVEIGIDATCTWQIKYREALTKYK
jgi:hypothetical protein